MTHTCENKDTFGVEAAIECASCPRQEECEHEDDGDEEANTDTAPAPHDFCEIRGTANCKACSDETCGLRVTEQD